MTEIYFSALQNIISEFKNISPEISNTFIFKKTGEIIADDLTTTQESIKNLINAFNSITERAQVIGGIENITIQAADNQVNVTPMNNLYLTTISSRAADQKIIQTLTHVLVPTVVKLVDQITTLPKDEEFSLTPKPEPKTKQEIELELEPIAKPEESLPIEETVPTQPIHEQPLSFSTEQILPEPPVNQFMVEKIGGFLVPPDTVHIDRKVVSEWIELYGDKKITHVNIETLSGKKTRCKFKPIKDAKLNGKGIIQIPEKILVALQTSKGKLVMVKPAIE